MKGNRVKIGKERREGRDEKWIAESKESGRKGWKGEVDREGENEGKN